MRRRQRDLEADPRVEAAFAAMPREHFLPAAQRESAGADRPLPIGHSATCSQPTTVRRMLALLDAREAHRVLDVGAGSGWTTALLATLVGSTGSVLGVELVPELAAWASGNVERRDVPWARVVAADPDRLGWPDEAPYDRILVSAGAKRLPDALLEQLAPAGVMVLPVRGRMLWVHRRPDGGHDVERLGSYSFVPLR